MDYFASRGYLVISPDYFHGRQLEKDSKEEGFNKDEWVGRWRRPTKDGEGVEMTRVQLLVEEWMPVVKNMFGMLGTKYGIIGYCFGGPLVIHYCEAFCCFSLSP